MNVNSSWLYRLYPAVLKKNKKVFFWIKKKVFLLESKCMICHSINALAEFFFEIPKSTSWVRTKKKGNKQMFFCILYVNLGWKTCFFFLLQKLAYFTTKNDANKLKRYVFSKTAIESAKKQWRQANTQCSQ